MSPQVFTHTMDLPLLWGRRALQGTFAYTSADPHAVTFTIVDRAQRTNNTAVWLIARDLLRDGCAKPVGDGDVQVKPGRLTSKIAIRVSSPQTNTGRGGEITVEVSRMLVQAFVARIYAAVPAGREHRWTGSIDDELTALLNAQSEGEGERA